MAWWTRRPAREEPIPINQVLWDELRSLGRAPQDEPAPPLEEIYARAGDRHEGRPLSALCLSGGGIRSATFNLGVAGALARLGILCRFDYLSSVSGGGYLAGWLKAWLHHDGAGQVTAELADRSRLPGFDPLAPEPRPVDHLREYSNYLTPRVGLFSADTWAMAALALRNMILNWLVLVPFMTAVVAVPQISLIVSRATPSLRGEAGPFHDWRWAALGLGAISAVWSSAAIYRFRFRGRDRAREETIVLQAGLPLYGACLCLSVAALWFQESFCSDAQLIAFSAVWCVALPLAGWAVARLSMAGREVAFPAAIDLGAIAISGAVMIYPLYALSRGLLPWLKENPAFFVILTLPILMGMYLLARVLFVAVSSLGEGGGRWNDPAGGRGEADREWWARFSGWVLILAGAWLASSALVVLGGYYFERYAHLLTGQVLTLGGISGWLTAWLGKSGDTGSAPAGERGPASPRKELILTIAGPVTAACLVFLLARLSAWVIGIVTENPALLRTGPGAGTLQLDRAATLAMLGWVVAVFLGFFLVSRLMGRLVDVNRFSAHGLYRNRLVRAYLGASHIDRAPDPFSGFDPADDLPLHDLGCGAAAGPLPVINVTLNLVRPTERLAWQQRKAESFSMTPLYCGNFHEGYRRTAEYGGPGGVTLGTAMTISGAAANPGAGYHSSPLIAFLMTLFNVRLGCWLGNTNANGSDTFRLRGPKDAWRPLFADLFGLTDRNHAYVNLSDGGHFENLGVYEMILRRCRLIVVSDAGQDPSHGFEDLGNLIRKVRIDFGIPITFDEPILILPRSSADDGGMLAAMGTIGYDAVDGPAASPGRLLFLKPTLLAAGAPLPYDVFGYARLSGEFPHETTADQWFSEAQFESYRALGQHIASHLAPAGPVADVSDFFDAVREELARRPPVDHPPRP